MSFALHSDLPWLAINRIALLEKLDVPDESDAANPARIIAASIVARSADWSKRNERGPRVYAAVDA